MRKIIWGALLLFAGYALFSAALLRLTDGFCITHIKSDLDYSSHRESSCPNEKAIQDLLKQNFYYLGKGSQCYVFESEDHDVVLKFFRFPRYRLHALAQHITAPTFLTDILKSRLREKQHKLHALFASCRLANHELAKETQILYLHLSKTDHLKQTVVLYDKLKRPFPISIDAYAFIIQKKGEQIYPYLTRLLQQGKMQEAQEALARLTAILTTCLQKGIVDNDAMIHKNLGFRNQKAFFLDIGGFERTLPANPNHILWQTTQRLRTWLNTQDPELASHFEQTLRNSATAASKASHQVCNKIPFLLKGV